MGAFRVNLYDSQGKYIRTIGKEGLETGTFARPKGVAVDHEGHIYVADAATQIIQAFDTDGHVLMYFGNPASTAGDSTCMPAGIAIDYDNVGQFQKFIAPNFAVEYLILVVNQFGAHKVSVFGYGHLK
jgi:DNA-binding beta-propeller fold protein YncE